MHCGRQSEPVFIPRYGNYMERNVPAMRVSRFEQVVFGISPCLDEMKGAPAL